LLESPNGGFNTEGTTLLPFGSLIEACTFSICESLADEPEFGLCLLWLWPY
jgi:hypothetical protein